MFILNSLLLTAHCHRIMDDDEAETIIESMQLTIDSITKLWIDECHKHGLNPYSSPDPL